MIMALMPPVSAISGISPRPESARDCAVFVGGMPFDGGITVSEFEERTHDEGVTWRMHVAVVPNATDEGRE